MKAQVVSVQNQRCIMQFNTVSGALIDFHFLEDCINPLNFRMPYTSLTGRSEKFEGHFICLGRWGDPSPAEGARGIEKHGDIRLQHWKTEQTGKALSMRATSVTEGLSIERNIYLDEQQACFVAQESITNISSLGRLYNVVQHPTIAQPFLNDQTTIDSNGFIESPHVYANCVFPFIVNPDDVYGWITAYSPAHQLMLGYVWKRIDYPWINHWVHNVDGSAVYRGLEFGTTGLHQPFNEIIANNLMHISGESTCSYIDAGEIHERSYIGFLMKMTHSFKGVMSVTLKDRKIVIEEKETARAFIISHNIDANGLLN